MMKNDLGDMTDELLLSHLMLNESRMQAFVDQYEEKKHVVTSGLVLNRRLMSLTRNFVNCALPRAITHILSVLQKGARKSFDPEVDQALDTLFDDREHLYAKLRFMLAMIKSPALLSEVVYTDRITFENVYDPVTSSLESGSGQLHGLAFSEFMGVELCMLINHRCVEVNEIYVPKVRGFSHEFYLYVVFHELSHLLVGSDDDSYSYRSDDAVEDFNVYSTLNLKSNEKNNADNYGTLIFIVLALMHKRGQINLKRF
jgi:hypothetical protein